MAPTTVSVFQFPSTPSTPDHNTSRYVVNCDALNSQFRARVAPFLLKLYTILSREDPKVIQWSNDGTAFHIFDQSRFVQDILAKYFKHRRFPSFQRQLNYFGFRKWTKTHTNVCTYSQDYFLRDNFNALQYIRRQNRKGPPRRRMNPAECPEYDDYRLGSCSPTTTSRSHRIILPPLVGPVRTHRPHSKIRFDNLFA